MTRLRVAESSVPLHPGKEQEEAIQVSYSARKHGLKAEDRASRAGNGVLQCGAPVQPRAEALSGSYRPWGTRGSERANGGEWCVYVV